MSQQIDTLMAVVTVLGIENPEVYGNMASLDVRISLLPFLQAF